jgi:hypothetical protein
VDTIERNNQDAGPDELESAELGSPVDNQPGAGPVDDLHLSGPAQNCDLDPSRRPDLPMSACSQVLLASASEPGCRSLQQNRKPVSCRAGVFVARVSGRPRRRPDR